MKLKQYIGLFVALLIVPIVLAQDYSIETKNDFTVEWYDFSTVSKGEYVISIQNLQETSRTFDLDVLLNNANIDLNKVTDLKLYEWTGVNVIEQVPIYQDVITQDCIGDYPNGTKCSSFVSTEIIGYWQRNNTEVKWDLTKEELTKDRTTTTIRENYGLMNLPRINSDIEILDGSQNGTKFFKITYKKPIERTTQGYGSSIDVSIESEGYNYHPVDTAQCGYYTPITIINNNNSAVISRAFNISINMTDTSRWNSNEYVMVANNSLEVDFNVSNPNTANAMVYFGMVNISAGGQTTLRLYHYGASCVGTEATIRGYDANYVSYNNTLKGAYLTFNEPEPKANQVNNLHTRNIAVSKSSYGMYNSQSYKNIDKGFCLDNANVSGGIDATGFSIEFWFSPVTTWTPASARKDIVGIAAAGSNDLLIDYNRLSTKMSAYYAPAGVSLGYVANFTAGRWYHVLYTNDGSTGKLYVDGILRDSQAQAGAITNKNTIFFMDKNDVCTIAGASTNPADMYIDEFSYYHDIIYPENTLRPPQLETITKGVDKAGNVAPSTPTLTSPSNTSTTSDNTPTLTWQNSTDDDGDAIHYVVELYNDSLMTLVAYTNNNVTETANPTSVTVDALTENTYYWRVLATDGALNSSWSANFSFTISTKPTVTIPSLSIVGNSYVNNLTDVYYSTVAQDPQGDTMTVYLLFYVNGVEFFNHSLASISNGTNVTILIRHENYSHFDTIKLMAYADDGTDTGNFQNSSTTEVLNSPPTTPATINPPSNFTTFNTSVFISCSGSSDLDNDTIRYEFYSSQTSPTTTLKQNTTTTQYELTNLSNGVHYWRCRTNDGVGNESSYITERNFTIDYSTIKTATYTYTLTAQESETLVFTSNLTYNSLLLRNVTTFLIYNSVNYSGNQIWTNGTSNYYFTLAAPDVSTDTNYTFNFSHTAIYYNTSQVVNTSSTFNQRITNTFVIYCTAGNSSHEVIAEFPILSEPNGTSINATMEGTFYVWISNRASASAINVDVASKDIFRICANPKGVNWSADADIYYSAIGFDNRQHYVRNKGFNATNIYNQSLYLLDETRGEVITFNILDENSAPLADHYVEVERKDFSNLTYTLVAIGKTDSDGETAIYLEQINAFYRFKIYNYTTLLKTTSDTQIKTTEIEITTAADLTQADVIKALDSVSGELSWTNATKTFSVTFTGQSSGNQELTRGCMRVTRYSLTGTDLGVVYDDCIDSYTGSLSYVVPDNSSQYTAVFYGTINGVDKSLSTLAVDLTSSFSDLLGIEGVVMAFFVVLSMTMIGLWSPAVAVGFAIFGVIISFSFGFISVAVGSIFGLIIIGGMFIYKLRQ